MLLNLTILTTVLAIVLVLWSSKVRHAIVWRAVTTPLASIIGSGFLVLGPILDSAYGRYAPLVMAGLCAGAFLFAYAIQYNIAAIARGDRDRLVDGLETVSSWALGFAYIISTAYYLNLFGAFSVSLTAVDDPFHARLMTSAVFIVILYVGWTRGFKALEGMEYVSVSAKLAIIAGLLIGLAAYFHGLANNGGLVFNEPDLAGWPALTLAFGLIVTVQGFETSRYLGADYDSRTRIVSMRWALAVSTAVYMAYILLLVFLFDRSTIVLSETAIVDMMVIVAPILPFLLVTAALAAQFSAAVADTSGSGGLFHELTRNRVPPRTGYLVLTVVGLALTWSTDIFAIISVASRAFALYYALQAAIAALTARQNADTGWRIALFTGLAVLGVLIAVFGQAVET